MIAIIRYATRGDVVSLSLEVPTEVAAPNELALERDWYEELTGGVASFEIRDANSLLRACTAAGCAPAAEAALTVLDAGNARPRNCWIRGCRVRVGQVVGLLHTDDPYTALSAAETGTVTWIGFNAGHVTVDVRWANGARLSLIPGSGDRWRPKEAT